MAMIRTLIALSICALKLAACGGGGKVHERLCREGFDRAFHCGSGLPWTDAQDFLQNRQIHPNGKITLHWRF